MGTDNCRDAAPCYILCSVIRQDLVLSSSKTSWGLSGNSLSSWVSCKVLVVDFAWRHCAKQGKVFGTNKPVHLLQGEVWLHLLKLKISPHETKISPWNLLSLCYGHNFSWNGCSCSSWRGPASAIPIVGWFTPPRCTGERKKRKMSFLEKILP